VCVERERERERERNKKKKKKERKKKEKEKEKKRSWTTRIAPMVGHVTAATVRHVLGSSVTTTSVSVTTTSV
jgi:hypothetical protein